MNLDIAGLNLVRTVQRIAAPHITTEYRSGISTGLLTRVYPSGNGVRHVPIESQDEVATPDEGGRMLRYRLDDLDDGIYTAESMGGSGASETTYFEVLSNVVARVFDGERRALLELRRRAR